MKIILKIILGVSIMYSLFFFSNHSTEKKYDYYVFAMEWPYAVCLNKKFNCQYINGYDNSRFNTHGLWPSSFSRTKNISFCNSSIHFNKSYLNNDLKEELTEHWNGVYTPISSFLQHEVKKHGSCFDPFSADYSKINSTELKDILNQMKQNINNPNEFAKLYIQVVLLLNKKYDLKKFLEEENILPNSMEYRVKDIKNAISKNLNYIKNYKLINEFVNKKPYLKEIRICLDLNFNPIDCPSYSNYFYKYPKEIIFQKIYSNNLNN